MCSLWDGSDAVSSRSRQIGPTENLSHFQNPYTTLHKPHLILEAPCFLSLVILSHLGSCAGLLLHLWCRLRHFWEGHPQFIQVGTNASPHPGPSPCGRIFQLQLGTQSSCSLISISQYLNCFLRVKRIQWQDPCITFVQISDYSIETRLSAIR